MLTQLLYALLMKLRCQIQANKKKMLIKINNTMKSNCGIIVPKVKQLY